VTVELVYETHSLTTDNEAGFATGWLPGRLSERGRILAAALGARRRDDGVDAVFASDLKRAVETAEIAFGGTAIPVHLDARLRECDYGALNGQPVALIEAERAKRITERYPGGESYVDVVARTRLFLADLVRDYSGRRVVVIAHSANKRALDHLLYGSPPAELVLAPFEWREGWRYVVPDDWAASAPG